MVVKQDSPIHKLDDVKGHTVIMLRGTTQAAWFDANMPDLSTLRLSTVSDALQALLQGRGDAFAADATTLVVIAAHDKSVRRVGEPFAMSDAAIGLRKNEPGWTAWVNAALTRMKAEKMFGPWLVKWVPAETRDFYTQSFESPKPNAR